MAKTATIQTRVDPKIKRNAQKILSTLNISMSEAISIYLTQITLNKGIPNAGEKVYQSHRANSLPSDCLNVAVRLGFVQRPQVW
jgi:addiction module RelB/DinJ family antitoxin